MAETRSGRIIPTDEFLAILNSNAATALNPFATLADIASSAFSIPVVANYSALPPANLNSGLYYNVANSQNQSWRPTWLGGTYYPKGIYYSDGTTWEYVGEFPFQADQATVDAGVNNTEFITPKTLNDSAQLANKLDKTTFETQNQLVKEPTGFPNRTDSTFSFDNGTRVFTIQPVGASFDYWTQGVKHTITTPKTITLPNITDKYFIYFTNLETLGQTITFDDSILNDKVFTATVYYNATTGKGEFVVDERHGLTMDWATHFHLHNAFGTRYYGGFGLSYTAGDGSLDAHAQIALGAGTIADEDIPTTIVDSPTPSAFFEQVLSPIAQIPVVYKLGAAEWRKDTANNFIIKDGSGNIYYNLNTAGTYTLEPVSNNSYVAVWVFATPDISTPVISILGNREDGSLNDAKNENTYDTINWADLPSQEYKILYRIIFEHKTTYANAIQARIVDVADLRGSIDATLNASNFTPVADHGNLIGLNDDDHCFSEDTELLTEEGFKTFNEIVESQTNALTLNLGTNLLEYNKVKGLYVYDSFKELISFSNKAGEILVTPKHTILYRNTCKPEKNPKSKYLKCTADEAFSKTVLNIPVNALSEGVTYDENKEFFKLLGLIISEGNFLEPKGNGYGIRIYQKEPQAKYIEDLLLRLDVPFTKKLTKLNARVTDGIKRTNEGTLCIFYLQSDFCRKRIRETYGLTSKNISDALMQLRGEQFIEFLKGLVFGDGSVRSASFKNTPKEEAVERLDSYDKKISYSYHTGDLKLKDELLHLLTLNGFKGYSYFRKIGWGKGTWSINISNVNHLAFSKRSKIPYDGKVWCVSVDNQTLVLRRKGLIFIAGNTQYYNQTRGDARYSQLGHTHTASDITDFDTEVANNTAVAANTAKLTALKTKSGVIPGASFTGNPRRYTLVFPTAFADANYSISIISVNARTWTVDAGQTAAQVVLNANAGAAITGNVFWTATKHGEN